MKKILSILALFACGVFAAQAQVDQTLQFVDKDGKVVENGAELNLTEVERLGAMIRSFCPCQ